MEAVVCGAPVPPLGRPGVPDTWTGRIILADDHPLVRRALGETIRAGCPGAPIEEVETLGALMTSVQADQDVALVLLDLRLPDCSGFAGLRALRERFPAIPVAVVSALEDDSTVDRALALGASGFIPKSARVAEFTEAIRVINGGGIWVPTCRRSRPDVGPQAAPSSLTPAQLRIVAGLQRGLPNKQIAYELGVTEATVKAHVTATFRKLGVASRMQALALLGREPRPELHVD